MILATCSISRACARWLSHLNNLSSGAAPCALATNFPTLSMRQLNADEQRRRVDAHAEEGKKYAMRATKLSIAANTLQQIMYSVFFLKLRDLLEAAQKSDCEHGSCAYSFDFTKTDWSDTFQYSFIGFYISIPLSLLAFLHELKFLTSTPLLRDGQPEEKEVVANLMGQHASMPVAATVGLVFYSLLLRHLRACVRLGVDLA